ncbi:MAG TPA: DUF2919 family protein [Thiobacillaceae bacterium]|nr:DUF2919 family protein [Thiobacillaceae bacterium]HNG54741.1 DUF2919 family protein [Nitrospira sp.]HNH88728.1 DUF2919 family protein [Thiobacillaceae bacterium]HNI07136.1 DUF2919 family protein [Thiobacillaceae bacterium]
MTFPIYPPEAYDRYLALKPSPLLVLIMLYCARHPFFVLLAFNPSKKLGADLSFLQYYATPATLVFGLPALALIAAWSQRSPTALPLWRTIWRHGKTLLGASLVAHFAHLAYSAGPDIFYSYVLSDSSRLAVTNLGVDLLAFYYLWRSPRVSDVFADFPSKALSDQPQSSP